MRIISGIYKGRRIKAPRGVETRPTADRVRESLFQIMESRWLDDGFSGRLVFDLYAGSGALGLEALSRGAGRVVFFESGPRAARTIRANLLELGVDDSHYELITRPLPSALSHHGARTDSKYHDVASVIFSDPPYDDGRQDELGALLRKHPSVAQDALWCHECSRQQSLIVDPWKQIDQRDYGDTSIRLMIAADSGLAE